MTLGFITGRATTQPPQVATTEAWVTTNVIPGLPGLVAGGVLLGSRQFIKDDTTRQEVANETYAIAKLVRSLMGGDLPDSSSLRKAIESSGGGGPLLDLTAIADIVSGYVDPYLTQFKGNGDSKFALDLLEAVASGFERAAASIIKNGQP